MSDPLTDFTGKIAVNVVTEIFKATVKNLYGAKEWVKGKHSEYDLFGTAARKYAQKLEERYNSIHIFGMTRPVALRSIFTHVNILEQITSRHRATVEELEQFFDRDLRSFGQIVNTKEGVEAINELQKVVILGKPGAGKTTFLKYLALQALDGNLSGEYLPVFVWLKEWSDVGNSLHQFIVDQFDVCDFPNANLFVSRMLSNGKCLILLDGFDEVGQRDVEDTVLQIRRFADKYSKNKFVLSCRVAAYNYLFEKFTEVEIADFTVRQIETFVNNWFGKGTTKARACLEALNLNRPVRELANVPLLLTLLCLTFDETMGFPANRAELYKEAIDALLKKWDASRSIKRDDIYRHLSLRRKESMFSRIAADTFERNKYFIPQRALERLISTYIANLPNVNDQNVDFDSTAILREIEAQHGILVERARGIYSFSHLTFQEYFTAQYLVEHESKGTVEKLVQKYLFTQTNESQRWREVFLLTANMLDNADGLLLLIQRRISDFGRDRLKVLLEGINASIKPFTKQSDSPSRALRLYYLLLRSTGRALQSETIQSRRIALAIVQMDPEMAKMLKHNPGEGELFQRAFSLDKSDSLRYVIQEKELPDLKTYLGATELLIDCLRTECYISKMIRTEIYENLISIDYARPTRKRSKMLKQS